MALTEKRAHEIEVDLRDIGQRLAKLEGHREGSAAPRSNNGALIALLSVLGVAVVGYWGWIGVQVVDHGNKLTEIYGLLAPQKLSQLSSDPTNPKNAKAAEQVLINAQRRGIPIPPAVVKDAGERFLETAASAPQSWDAALNFLDYRSFLNTDYRRFLDTSNIIPLSEPEVYCDPGKYVGSLRLNYPDATKPRIGHAFQISCFGKDTPPDKAARIENLSVPQPSNGSSGMAVFILKIGWGAHLSLDEAKLKNVVIINAVIDYDGGPLVLDHVFFVNCSFALKQGQPSEELGKAILASASTTFEKSATHY